MTGTICFNGFACREESCRAWEKERGECVFILAARATLPPAPPAPPKKPEKEKKPTRRSGK